jgi:apolipoprotein N-acyltransferase
MQDIASTPSPVSSSGTPRLSAFTAGIRSVAPSIGHCSVAVLSGALLILSFPNFDLWPLAWLALVPLLLVVARCPQPSRAFFLGWIFGTVFFYGSCYWLTYSMIHFGGLSPWLAFALLLPGALLLGVFPALFSAVLARAINKWGIAALLLAPLLWSALEWTRLSITGQLWNAIGYSQAYHPVLIQTARWGGVYGVGVLIVLVNAVLAYLFIQ